MANYVLPVFGDKSGFNDSIQFGRIGSGGAFRVVLDFAKLKPLTTGGAGIANGDVITLCKLPGNSAVRGFAFQTVKPLLAGAAAPTLSAWSVNTVSTPQTGAAVTGTAIAGGAAIPAYAGGTILASAATPLGAIVQDIGADGSVNDNELRLTVALGGTTPPPVTEGILVIVVYMTFALTKSELLTTVTPDFAGAVSRGSSVPNGGTAN